MGDSDALVDKSRSAWTTDVGALCSSGCRRRSIGRRWPNTGHLRREPGGRGDLHDSDCRAARRARAYAAACARLRSPQRPVDRRLGLGDRRVLGIARCASTAEQDTTPRSVRNDLNDRFCLNGNKLRLVTGTYGVAGSEYRTEIETYSRIKAFGSAGNGPAHFIVEGKDGLIYEFGNSGNSRIESKGQPTARAWALNEIRDRDGNEITFTYVEDTTNGSYRLDLVSYAGNSSQGTSAIYTIDLVYEPKPTEEIDSAYLAGSVIKETQRLSRIDVLHNGSTLFRRYELNYEPALSATKRSRLASVQECAGSGSNCLASTQFTYQDGTPPGAEANTGHVVNATTVFPIDVNSDGREDLVYPNGTGPWTVMFANTSGSYNTRSAPGLPAPGAAGRFRSTTTPTARWICWSRTRAAPGGC